MNILERAEKAAELKKNGVCNCAQAVASVLADQTDLSEEELMKINAGFAVGMGNMEATCGEQPVWISVHGQTAKQIAGVCIDE